MSFSNQADFYLNFQQFGNLKLQAREGSNEAAQNVAQQFEGLFVQQMLAAMRAATQIDDGQNSSQMSFYQEMFDRQLAQTIAGQDRLGMSRLILKQIPVGADGVVTTQDLPPQELAVRVGAVLDAPSTTYATRVAKTEPNLVATEATANPSVVLNRILDNDFAEVSLNQQRNPRWHEPGQFVADILPQARSAAQTLGVSAELLIAQAALETGWGKHAMTHADGRNGFNLFGIKAGQDWSGHTLSKPTLEFRDGMLRSEVSQFRAYRSPRHSLIDYVDFIRSSPRYAPVLESAGNDQAYIRGIHAAGYATDPDYADKVLGILDGELLQRSLASLNSEDNDHA